MRDLENRRRATADNVAQLHVTRTRLKEQGAKLPSVETELQKVRDQIAFLEGASRTELLVRFDSYGREHRWLEDVKHGTERLGVVLGAGSIDRQDVKELAA